MTRIMRPGGSATARGARAGAWLAVGVLVAASAARATSLYDASDPGTLGGDASVIGSAGLIGGQSNASLPTPACGNGIVEPGEQCDNGPGNGTLGACCTATCESAAPGTSCPGGTCNATGTCSCGNGVVEDGEQCDDGPANGTPESCCAWCSLQPQGSPCADDGDLCTWDYCAGVIDRCVHEAGPSGGCATPTVPGGASIFLQTRPSGQSRAEFKWGEGPPVPLADFGDPGSEATRLCVYFQPGHQYMLIAAASPSVTAGGAWTRTATGWRFRSKTGAPDGVTGVTLKAGMLPLKAKVAVTAHGNPTLGIRFPQSPPLVVQFKTATGTCWEATFLTPIKSTATTFKAKSDVLP